MSLESYLTMDETAADGYEANGCKWVVSDQRVMKYKEGSGTEEVFHDLSLDKITSIGVVRTGREAGWIIWAAIVGIIGVALFAVGVGTSPLLMLPALLCFGLAMVFVIVFIGSDKSYFRIRAAGISDEDHGVWKMNASSTEEIREVREFTKAVREKVNQA